MLDKLSQGPRTNQDLGRVGAGLGRGPSFRKKQNAKQPPWVPTFPSPQATIDVDFVNNLGFFKNQANTSSSGQTQAMSPLAFTRASSATFVQQDGTLVPPPNALGVNLVRDPEALNTFGVWATFQMSVTANVTTAPDGSLTADLCTPTGGISSVYQNVVVQTGVQYTFSVWAKGLRGGETFKFDFEGGLQSPVQTVSDQWQRFTWTVTPNSANNNRGFRDVTFGSAIYFWGAQVERGSTATPYFPSNNNTPRFDWASSATLVNRNLLTFTEQFDNNSVWQKNNTTVSVNSTTAPDGTSTADKIIADATNTNHFIRLLGFSTTSNVVSIYAKAAEVTTLVIDVANTFTSQGSYNLINGTASASGGTASIVDVGNGWYRCVFRAGGVGFSYSNAIIFSLGTFLGNATDGLFLWGAQLELGSSATDYQAIAQATTNTPLAATTTCNGILIEEQRTNRILWCRDATQAQWVKTDVTAAKDQTGVDGVANAASSLTATADNGTCIQTITLASGGRAGSVYLKRITGTGNVQFSMDGTNWSTVDLSDTEWRRVNIIATVTNPTIGIRLATNGDAVAMDFAQVEDGTFITTPIFTTTATVTRSADYLRVSGTAFANGFNQIQGTHFLECRTYPSLGSNTNMRLIGYGFPGNQTISPIVRANDTQIYAFDGVSPTGNYGVGRLLSADNKLIGAYDRTFTVLGANAQTPSFGQFRVLPVGITEITLFTRPPGADFVSGYIKRYTYYPVLYSAPTLRIISGATP
jgi:hypothetical protein